MKIIKNLAKVFIALLAFIILYIIAAFTLPRIGMAEEANQKDEVTIHILTNGVHTDIVVPTINEQKDWSKTVKFSNIASKDTSYPYLAIGWGDKGFYLETPTWSELKASVAFRAATGLSTSALHATYYRKMLVDTNCRKIDISKDQYTRLIEYINNTAQTDPNGNWIYIPTNANYSDSDAFYDAKGRYHLFNTCNSWANKALKACGQKHCLWTPFDTGIFMKYP